MHVHCRVMYTADIDGRQRAPVATSTPTALGHIASALLLPSCRTKCEVDVGGPDGSSVVSPSDPSVPCASSSWTAAAVDWPPSSPKLDPRSEDRRRFERDVGAVPTHLAPEGLPAVVPR